MSAAEILTRLAAELALFAGVGFLLFGLNDMAVDIVYFVRRFWRRHTVYKRYRRKFASYYAFNKNPGFIAIFVPAWDESAVIAQMLRSTLKRLDYPDYRIFVGHYRNDRPARVSLTDPRLAASLRTTTPIGGSSGGEVAAGVRLTPFPSLPFAVTAERRQAIGRFSTGRSDFALFAEGGVYQKPLGWDLLLDGYAQAGVVGFRSHDFFADGGLAVSRPVWGRFSAGMGVWGGYQPGLYRVDAGPRISMRVGPNVSVHLDWRQRLAGAAEPGSGPAVTLGANF